MKLHEHVNIVAWALHEKFNHDKNKLLDHLNSYGTRYTRDHLNNWLAERKDTPKWVVALLGGDLLDACLTTRYKETVKRLLSLGPDYVK